MFYTSANKSRRAAKSGEEQNTAGHNIPSMQAKSFKARHRDWQLEDRKGLVKRISQLKDDDEDVSLREHISSTTPSAGQVQRTLAPSTPSLVL